MNALYVQNFFSDILSQKFPGSMRNFCQITSHFFILTPSGAHMEKWWIWKRCGMKFWIYWSRNFWHMAEISATSIFWPKFLDFPKYFPKWAKLSFSSLKHVKNTPDHIFISIFGQRCSFRSFWVCWRARAPYRSEKRSRSKISQNGPKLEKCSFGAKKVSKSYS